MRKREVNGTRARLDQAPSRFRDRASADHQAVGILSRGDKADAAAISQCTFVCRMDSSDDECDRATRPIDDVVGDDAPEHVRPSLAVAEQLTLAILLHCRIKEMSLIRCRATSMAGCGD